MNENVHRVGKLLHKFKCVRGVRNIVTRVVDILQECDIGKEVKIQGWITSIRKHKKTVFVDLNDGSTREKLQITVPQELFVQVSPGSSIMTVGKINLSPKGQIELLAEDIKIFGNCLTADGYPFGSEKKYSSEYMRQYLHFRPRSNKFSSLLRIRSKADLIIHSYLQSEGYIHIHTPILTSNDCEGAGDVFKVIPDNMDMLKLMVKDKTPLEEAFFDTKAFLSVSGQLHLEAAAHSLSKVYTFGPTFRAENSKTRLHLSEFYMLEAEIAFLEKLSDLIMVVEKLVKSVTKTLLDTCQLDTKLFCDENQVDLNWLHKDFSVLTYDEAGDILKRNGGKIKKEFNYEEGLSKEHEIFLVNHCGNIPTFIINWPKLIKPFYMKECDHDNSKVAAFDLLAPRIGEIVGGSLRESSYTKLEKRLPVNNEQLKWYLDLRKFGGVPTGGFGLGFERYVSFLLGVNNIKDAIPFPRWPHNCSL